MSNDQEIHHYHQWAALLVFLLLAFGLIFIFREQPHQDPTKNTVVVIEEQVVEEELPITRGAVRARWLIAGEVFWGRQIEVLAENSANPYKYPFAGFQTFDRGDYDAWIGQLECPVTTKTIPFSIQANQLLFNCSPDYLEEFAKWFDAVSLANNHMDNVDFEVGLLETRQHLEDAEIQHYGHYDPAVIDDLCEIISLPVAIDLSDGSSETANLPVAMCGYNYVFREPRPSEIEEIAKYSKYFFTIISPQMGAEYVAAADSLKIRTYRSMIDQGADMVIASHPHWVQNTEVYEGKLIMYSVGNWLFDQEWSEEVKRGAALDLSIGAKYDDNLKGWLELGEECFKYQDSCLTKAEKRGLEKPVFTLKHELVSGYHENGQTRLAPESVEQLNLTRTNWAETKVKINPHD
ncbi:MAG: CapA family protein [Candidatus Saccharimonadales bacterium]|nr:CapA family protein [Candidatus Saccharimonadales bacterium]